MLNFTCSYQFDSRHSILWRWNRARYKPSLVSLMWKHANSLWWWNQLIARHKNATPYKDIKAGGRGELLLFRLATQTTSGPGTAPVLFRGAYRMWMLAVQVDAHTRCISRQRCQGYVNMYTVSYINHSCPARWNLGALQPHLTMKLVLDSKPQVSPQTAWQQPQQMPHWVNSF